MLDSSELNTPGRSSTIYRDLLRQANERGGFLSIGGVELRGDYVTKHLYGTLPARTGCWGHLNDNENPYYQVEGLFN